MKDNIDASPRLAQKRWHFPRSLILTNVLSCLLSACAIAPITVGEHVNPNLLETSLRLGRSTSKEVMTILGKPYSTGKSMLSFDGHKPRTVWVYYYDEGAVQGSTVYHGLHRMFVWVYFDEDRYDGYLWFSSLPK